MKIISIVSGGMDSVSMLYQQKAQGHALHVLSFNYGQRHKKELEYAKAAARDIGALWDVVDLSGLTHLIGGSSLTDNIPVPDGHYAEENMKITVVPNRNAIMLAIAYGVAVAEQADAVATAVHAGDHFIYPDCRPAFTEAFAVMQNHAIDGFGRVQLLTPFITCSKSDIVKMGAAVGTPFDKTWSCYKGSDIHCGTCGTCVERKEAFELAGIPDPTEYLK
jgi:7-cyano-7-deazaguanine synthase